MKKIAIIDLGTNTFNLLIVLVGGDGTYQIYYSGKLPVKLGDGGINQKVIAPKAYQRGLNAVGEHLKTTQQHGVSEVFAFATSATRNAENGTSFITDIKNLYGIDVKVIGGEEEVELIYLGIRQAIDLSDENVLMLDIGGGSNEIIIGNKHKYFWGKSYDLGISRLLQQFNPSDPIKTNEILAVELFLKEQLADLSEIIDRYKPVTLVGSSGSFDTYRNILSEQSIISSNGMPSVEISLNKYLNLHKQLISSTTQERSQIPGMDSMRVDMIVLATIFTHFLVKSFGIKRILQSSYALKEGAIWRIINS
ncbi:MAG TPA: phosphatase [Bacteroidales bacterium]|jgi:exopolyphosphatase/guanosine-5'-triphosphate,3'-diphosphate pyrophosphatase|nr:phosphatase [Bacteroidales bacterium]